MALAAVMPNGGLIPVLDIIVMRKYPIMYVETMPDGTKVVRNERDNQQLEQKYQVRDFFLGCLF
jgi:hypothetical protein